MIYNPYLTNFEKSHCWNVPRISRASTTNKNYVVFFVDLCRFSILFRMKSVEDEVKSRLWSYYSGSRLWCLREKHRKHITYFLFALLRTSNCSCYSYLSIFYSNLINTSTLSIFWSSEDLGSNITIPDYFYTSWSKSNILASLSLAFSPYFSLTCWLFCSTISFKIF